MCGKSAIESVNAPRFLRFSEVLCFSLILRDTIFLAQMLPYAMFITSTTSPSP